MKKQILSFWFIFLALSAYSQKSQKYELKSPNSKFIAEIIVDENITFDLSVNGTTILKKNKIGLKLQNNSVWGKNEIVKNTELENFKEIIHPPYGIKKDYPDNYNQLILYFEKEFKIIFRLYNEGFAYRFVSQSDKEVIIQNEIAEYYFNGDQTVYYPETESFQTPFEKTYPPKKFTELQNFCITPVLVSNAENVKVLITEADLRNYPALFLKPNLKNGFNAIFPKYPLKEKLELPGRLHLTKLAFLNNMKVSKTADYIAKIPTKHKMPWRVFIVAEHDKDLLDNHLVYNLGEPSKMNNTSWIEPGKVAWDWYNHWELEGVDFKPGVNTETYKYYIDFAAKNGLKYVNFDEGWCDNKKLDKINKDLDFHYLVEYAHKKNVKVFVWMIWWVLDEKMEYYLDTFQKWNIDGLKVDFMDRGDQRVVEFFEKLAQEASKRKLMLNLHGAYRPTGMERTYPNMINREGVIGLENNKFGHDATSTHNVSLPFTRMVTGQTDYTPGSMFHVTPENYSKNWTHPTSMTTRCQQLAMYVVYYGPLQMLSEAPTTYEKDSVVLDYLRQVPTVWDDTHPIQGEIGKYVVTARQKDNNWYIGGMCGTEKHTAKFALDFLDPAEYEATIYKDGEKLSDCIVENQLVTSKNVLKIDMKQNGGFAIILKKK